MLRYLNQLQKKDLSLADAMIPLGSCTMKLNATTEMIPVTFPGFSNIHPFVPLNQAKGYATLIKVIKINSRNWNMLYKKQLGLAVFVFNPIPVHRVNILDLELFSLITSRETTISETSV